MIRSKYYYTDLIVLKEDVKELLMKVDTKKEIGLETIYILFNISKSIDRALNMLRYKMPFKKQPIRIPQREVIHAI